MRLPRTLSRYMARAVLGYTALGLLAITTVMVTQNLFRFLDEMISANATAADFVAIVGSLCLMLATYTVPIAFLLGVLVAFGRFSSDGEVLAMQACGLGLRSLFGPTLALGVLMAGLTAYLLVEVEHRAHLSLRQRIKTMTARGGFIEPGRFRHLGDRVLFVKNVDASNRLEGVVISDRSDSLRPLMIFAETGRFNWNSERNELEFRLKNGDIHVESAGQSEGFYQRIEFQSFAYRLDAGALFGRSFSTLRPREMTLAQLHAVVARAEAGESLQDLRRADPIHYQLQIQRRLALPFAPFLFGFVGSALGFRPRHSARSWGVILCIALVFGYYVMLTFGEFLALQGTLSAGLALWLPNLAFALGSLLLVARMRREGV